MNDEKIICTKYETSGKNIDFDTQTLIKIFKLRLCGILNGDDLAQLLFNKIKNFDSLINFNNIMYSCNILLTESVKKINDKDYDRSLKILRYLIDEFKKFLDYSECFTKIENNNVNLFISMCCYNCACCHSLKNDKDNAVLELKKSIDNGFNYFRKMIDDIDLLNIIDCEEVVELIKNIINNNKINKENISDKIDNIKLIPSQLNHYLPNFIPPIENSYHILNSKYGDLRKYLNVSENQNTIDYCNKHNIQIIKIETLDFLFS